MFIYGMISARVISFNFISNKYFMNFTKKILSIVFHIFYLKPF